jgi:hypothetical protein
MNTNRKQHSHRKRFPVKSRSVMTAVRLGIRYGVTDDQIRNWSKLPRFPRQVRAGRWRVSEFDKAVSDMRAAGGPRAWRWFCFAASEKDEATPIVLPMTMSAVQLGARYSVSDDTVRSWSDLPAFPPRAAPGRWQVAIVDEWVKVMRRLGGPMQMKACAQEMLATGRRLQALTPAKIAEHDDLQDKLSIFLSEVTDTEDLLRAYVIKPGTTDEFIPAPSGATSPIRL